MSNQFKQVAGWALRLLATFIMGQSLFFKFSGAEESLYIFSTLGIEPWGRIGTGVIELAAVVLILIPKTTLFGAVIGFGTMAGAILSHLTVLGIEVKNDNGLLFIYACVTLASCLILILINKSQLEVFTKQIRSHKLL